MVRPVRDGTGASAPVFGYVVESRAIASARYRYGARRTLSLRGIGAWDHILVIGLGDDASMADIQLTGAVAGRAVV